MKVALLALSLTFAIAVVTPFFASDAFAQMNPPGGAKSKSKKGGCSSYSRNRACY